MSEIVLLSAGFALHDGAMLHDEKIDINHRYVKAVDYSTKFTNLYSEDFFYIFQSLF